MVNESTNLSSRQSNGVARFFKAYRIMWLSLTGVTFVVLPVITLGFFGFIPWISSATALLSYLMLLGLHITMFVAGRWSPAEGFSALEIKSNENK